MWAAARSRAKPSQDRSPSAQGARASSSSSLLVAARTRGVIRYPVPPALPVSPREPVSRRASGRLAGELGAVQVGVQPARFEELGVRAALGDPAAVDHQD